MMRHAITVGMGFGKKTIGDALASAAVDDVIVIDPGEYRVDQGFTVNKMDIRGGGTGPSEVVLYTDIAIQSSGTLKLTNLTVINTHLKKNAIFVDQGGQLIADRTVIKSQGTSYATIYAAGNVGLSACEIYNDHEDAYGLYVDSGGYASLAQCDVGAGVGVESSKMEIKSSQVHNSLSLDKNGEVDADDLYLTQANPDVYLISVRDGSALTANQLSVPEGQSEAHVVASRFRVPRTNIDPFHMLTVTLEGSSDFDVAGAQVKQTQSASSSQGGDSTAESSEAAEESEPASEAPVSSEADDTVQTASAEKPAIDQLHEMIGLTKLKEQVDAFIKVARFNKKRAEQGNKTSAQSLHSLFLGNPGTGKTTVARLVAKVMYENGVMPSSNYVEVTRQDLVSDNVGGTALKTQKVLESALGGVLFIDEAYTLYQEGGSVNWGQEAVDTILKYMEDHRNDLMIIFAGYTKQMQDFMNMNPGLTSRAPNVFEFEDYTPEEIAQIGLMSLHHDDYKIDEAYYTKAVMKAFRGDIDHSNGRWVRNYNEKLIQTFVMNLPEGAADITTIPNSDIDLMAGGDDQSKAAAVDDLLKQLNGMVGLTSVKAFVNDLVKRVKVEQKLQDELPDGNKPTYHMIFSGAPGTGKTTVARIIAKLFYNLGILPTDSVKEVSRPDLVGRYVGETAQKTSKVIRDAMGGVLFVDEAYQLSQGSENDFGKEAIETFITELENNRDKFVAIFAGYTSDMNDFLEANAGLQSRIPLTLNFDAYTPKEVAQIVLNIVTQKWTVNEALLTQTVVDQYQALPEKDQSNGRWARTFADNLISKHKLWLSEHLNDDKVDIQHIQDSELGGEKKDQDDREQEVDVLLKQLDGMVGLDSVKKYVHELVERITVEQKLKDKLPDSSKPTYHMVFSGAPGTGKTTVARIIAKLFYNLGILPKDTVKEVSRPDLVGQYVGQTEQKTSKVIRDAMGGVLFVDEAYQLSQGGSNDFGKEAIETFITELENNRDKFVAIFAGYTNDMQQFLEANAGLRSRIPLTLDFEPYTPEQVAQIVDNIVLKDWTVNEELLKSIVAANYKKLPENEQSNGRWARTFAEKLIAEHKLWLGQHLDADPDLDVKHIQDKLLYDSIGW